MHFFSDASRRLRIYSRATVHTCLLAGLLSACNLVVAGLEQDTEACKKTEQDTKVCKKTEQDFQLLKTQLQQPATVFFTQLDENLTNWKMIELAWYIIEENPKKNSLELLTKNNHADRVQYLTDNIAGSAEESASRMAELLIKLYELNREYNDDSYYNFKRNITLAVEAELQALGWSDVRQVTEFSAAQFSNKLAHEYIQEATPPLVDLENFMERVCAPLPIPILKPRACSRIHSDCSSQSVMGNQTLAGFLSCHYVIMQHPDIIYSFGQKLHKVEAKKLKAAANNACKKDGSRFSWIEALLEIMYSDTFGNSEYCFNQAMLAHLEKEKDRNPAALTLMDDMKNRYPLSGYMDAPS